MKKFGLLGSSASSAVLIAAACAGAPAFAQSSTQPTSQEVENKSQAATGTLTPDTETSRSADAETVVVTGSRIRSPNIESVLPITSIGGEEFFQQGQNNIGDTLNDLPQLRSTFAQQNPGLGIGIAGLNLLDLRGLGTSRTLVLVNGRRHVAGDILNNAVSPDVNTIPQDLIERVDIVTGGNSAVYGSDAIAGVVNFVLKRDFDGLQVRGNAGVSEAGYGGNQYVSALVGRNFAEGRGNVTLHAEYARQERIFGSNIPFLRRVDGLGVIDVDTTGLPESSDGFPDRTFIRDIRSASIHRFGLVPITQNSSTTAGSAARCGIGLAATNGGPSSVGGSAYNCTYIFNETGALAAQTGTRYSTGIIGGIAGGNGQTGREDKQLSVLPYLQRINTNLLAHYTFSDAAEVFLEAKYAKVDTLGSNAGPSFIQGTFGQYDIRERIRLDNPFLTTANRTTIANAILASGCNTSLTALCNPTAANPLNGRTTFGGQGIGGPLSAADIAQINAGTYRFVVARNLVDSGIRDEKFQRETYRVVGGLRGTFNDDWNYEISGNYGEYIENTTTYGYLDRQRFMLSLDAGRNPATGQIQCRAQFDPASAVAFTQGLSATQVAAQQARLASDIAACVPYNPFGQADNSAAANYFVYNARHHAKLTQFDATAFVGGDLSQLFELPGGPISFVIGGEYRRETALYNNDPFVESGATNAVVIGEFDPPSFEVKEAFGEVRVPILKDLPFAHTLSLSGAARVSDYKGATGTVWAYNGGAEWAPVRDIRFRFNYGRSVRAPNVSETGFPLVPNFAPGFVDPCSPAAIGQGQFRAANCQADLGGLLANITNRTYSLPIVSGSNPNLSAEKADSYTVGAVIQPRWLPGMSLSVDYFNIKVKNVIATLAAQTIANLCYDSPTLNNQFCQQFTRFRGPGSGPLGEVAGDILGNSLLAGPVNYAKRIREGIDVDFAYRQNFTETLSLDTRLIYTHQLKNSNYQDPTNPNFENRLLEELGDPQDEFRWDVNFGLGPLTLGYQMRYIGPMYVNAYEDFNPLQDRAPQNSDYADIQKYDSVLYHDLRIDYRIKGKGLISSDSDMLFFVGVDNFTNVKPPLGSTATGAGSAIYSIRGRNFFAGFRARF
jgi:outer membrane receptor protein involved in Fe transport